MSAQVNPSLDRIKMALSIKLVVCEDEVEFVKGRISRQKLASDKEAFERLNGKYQISHDYFIRMFTSSASSEGLKQYLVLTLSASPQI